MSYGEVLDFWFGPLDADGQADEAHRRRWFMRDEAFDEELRRRFGALHEEISKGGHAEWLREDLGCVAAVVVLDQLSRNLFRGSPRAFAQDAHALQIATEALDRSVHRRVGRDPRSFLFMPFMHAEDLGAQQRCVALFTEHGDENALRYAVAHRDIIARFGRFPHRNAILGRSSSPEEIEFLKQPGSSF